MKYVSKAFQFFKYEFYQVLPPTLYFLFMFNVVALTTSMVLTEFEIHVSAHAVATVLALVVGKVVLVVNKLSLLKRFDDRPLIYPILFKSTVYTAFVLMVRLLEHWLPGLIDTGSLTGAADYLVEHVVLRIFIMGQIWIFVLFIVYTTAVEFISLFALTSSQLFTAFFRQRPATNVAGDMLGR